MPLNKKETEPLIKIVITPQIAIDEISAAFKDHYKCREDHIKIKSSLESQNAQMRLIQRSLLMKLESKRTGALENIMMLFKYTHNQLADIMRQLDNAESNLHRAQVNLSCAFSLTKMMVKHFDLPSKTTDALCAVLISPVQDWFDQNWEQITAPSIEMLNYIGPLKKSKNNSLDDNPTFNFTSLDIDKFNRHLSSLLERVCRLTSNDPKHNTELQKNDSNEQENESDDNKQSDWLNMPNESYSEFKF